MGTCHLAMLLAVYLRVEQLIHIYWLSPLHELVVDTSGLINSSSVAMGLSSHSVCSSSCMWSLHCMAIATLLLQGSQGEK